MVIIFLGVRQFDKQSFNMLPIHGCRGLFTAACVNNEEIKVPQAYLGALLLKSFSSRKGKPREQTSSCFHGIISVIIFRE